MTNKRHLLVPVFAALVIIASLATAGGKTALSATFKVGEPTIVDPIRSGAEPIIAIDNKGNPMVSAPGGSTVTTSWYWKSHDGGQSYQMLGPSSGHFLCSTGGGDSLLAYDKVSGDMYLTDQQSLASLATGKMTADGTTTSACFTTPAMSADRPFEAILHPTGKVVAPQVRENGGKPIVYLSWQCNGCFTGNAVNAAKNEGPGGLAYAWSDDGTHWHAADPGVPVDTLVTDQFYEAPVVTAYQWHGTMYADPETGNVFTAISCSSSGCPNGKTDNEFGVVEAKPGANRTDSTNAGQFASEEYRTVANKVNGKPMPDPGSLFPLLTGDSAGTLYMAWVQGDGFASDVNAAPPASSWHVYYSYSTDKPDHKVWSAPIRVDQGIESATTVFTWAQAGDPGKLAFTWLATPVRENPSRPTAAKPWYPYMAVVTGADTAHPAMQQSRVGVNPMHIGDICLRGTICVASNGNRNLADFISVDIAPNGAAMMTWCSDANQVSTLPTSTQTGVPITLTARQTAGPRLIGSGNVGDDRFSVASTGGKADIAGDGALSGATSAPDLDLTGSSVSLKGSNVHIQMPVSNLADLSSPDSSKSNVWWLTIWQFKNKIYFAKAESDSNGTPTFTAGEPSSFDRPGIALGTIPAMFDYRGGTSVTGSKVGNQWMIDVPASVVGSPKQGDLLESVASFTVLDNGLPPFATAVGNVPSVIDSTPAYNATLGSIPVALKPAPKPVAKPVVKGTKQTRRLAATGVGSETAPAVLLLIAAAALIVWRRRKASIG